MNRRFNSPCSRGRRKRAQSGYILLLLILAIAIIAIMMTAAATRMAHQVKRDRETEMIHRGEQYARAVKKYVQKMKTYPTSIEQLEKTNNVRFLRKRYKDPMTPDGKWKLVRLTDVQLGGASSGTGFGGLQGSNSNANSANKSSNSGSIFGGGSQGGTVGGDKSSSSGSLFSSSLSGQTFGGGPIAGVASMSEQNGIREFNNKKKYNQWMFVYVMTQDQCQSASGCIIKGPYNPQAGTIGGSKVGVSAGDLNKPPPGQGGEVPPPSTDLGPK